MERTVIKINQLIIVAVMFLLLNSACDKKNNLNQYVEIIHTGITTHIDRILYISSKRPVIKLNNEQLNEIRDILGDSVKITKEKIDDYIGIRYKIVLTDPQTIMLIENYISEQTDFYVKVGEPKYNSGASSYDVQVNGTQTFSINYKLRAAFFKRLTDFLKQKKCDEKVIQLLSRYEY